MFDSSPEAAAKILRELPGRLAGLDDKLAELEGQHVVVLVLVEKIVETLERVTAEKGRLEADVRQLLERVATLELRALASVPLSASAIVTAALAPAAACESEGCTSPRLEGDCLCSRHAAERDAFVAMESELAPLASATAAAIAAATPTTSPTPATETPHTEAAPPAPPQES